MRVGGVDRGARGFEWRLASLERKLQWELDAAQTQLAAAVAHCELTARSLQDAEALQQRAAQEARAAMALHADPHGHQRLLRYLLRLADQIGVAAERDKAASELVAQARAAVLHRQQRLDVLLRVRRNALRAFQLRQSRRADAEADAAWLALRHLRGAVGCAEECQ